MRSIPPPCRLLTSRARCCAVASQVLDPPYDVSHVDTWSLGCVALELALGGEWFKCHWLHMYMTHVKLRDHCGLVQGLAVKRASALKIAGAASHAALRDFLVKALEFHPPERLTPASALRHAWLSPPPADGEPDVVLDDRQTLETWEADDDAVSTVQRATAENLPVGPGEWQAEP